jgi:hypothetical protein
MSLRTPLEATASQICNSPYAMVFGFASCHYNEVAEGLRASSLFTHIFNYTIGYERDDEAFEVSPPISQIKTNKTGTSDTCKAALVNIVFENYKRKQQGKPLIPVLFVIDCENNRHSLTSNSITTKEENQNKIITFKEIRRAYKLCEEFDDPEIRAVAKETFKFVKANDDLSLKEIPVPWEKSDWPELWKARKKAPKKFRKKLNWKSELHAMKKKHTNPGKKTAFSTRSLDLATESTSSFSSSRSPTITISSESPTSPSILSDSSESSPPSSPILELNASPDKTYRRKTNDERSSFEMLFIKSL